MENCRMYSFVRGIYFAIKIFKNLNYTGLQGFVVRQLRVISEVIFCVESESEVRIGPSRQDFEIFEVIYSKNGFWATFEVMYRTHTIF